MNFSAPSLLNVTIPFPINTKPNLNPKPYP